MNDLIGDLALRSLQLAVVAEPRLPARFEPTPWSAPRLLGSEGTADLEEAAVKQELVTPRNSDVPRAVAVPRVSAADLIRPAALRVDPDPPEVGTHASPDSPREAPPVFRSIARLESRDRVASGRVARGSERVVPEGAEARPATPARLTHRGHGEPDTLLPVESRSTPRAPRVQVADVPSVLPRREPAPTIPLHAAPSLLPRIVRDPVPTRRGSATDGETVVHVTIGRVEVRAIPAVKPRQASRTASPRLTLDQYLERRGRSARE
jgi:hypothetical protein